MSKLFVVESRSWDCYDSSTIIEILTVPDNETVETVQSVFMLASQTYDENKYKVFELEEWLKLSIRKDWETMKTEIETNAKKYQQIEELKQKIENAVRDIFHLRNGIGDYPDPDAQIKKWEEDIECYQQKIDELMGTNEI